MGNNRKQTNRGNGARDFRPPKGLTGRARALWVYLVPGQIETPGRLELLRVALEALSEYDVASEAVRREGRIVSSRRSGLSHPHPLIRVCEKNRRIFLRYARLLRLHCDASWNLETWPTGGA